MIPILDLKRQIAPIRKELDLAIKNVIDNVSFVFGKETDELEVRVKNYCKVRYAVGVSNGSDALRLSLLALGIKKGDKVLCPTFTFFATAGAISAIGATPVFVDIDPLTYNISVDHMKMILKKNRSKIKAVIPVHLYGQCADMQEILKIASRFGLKVIEDAAQAFGAKFGAKKAGAMGGCGAISFFPGKNLGAFGDAGMVLTNNKAVYETLLLLRNQGHKNKYQHLITGYNHRLDSIQAAVLKVKLKYIDRWNQRRREVAEYYNRELCGLDLRTPYVLEGNVHVYHQYVLRLPSASAQLISHLRSRGIDARVYYPLPLHLQPCFKYLGYKNGDFSEAEIAAKRVLAIPAYPDLTKKELKYIVCSIKEFLHE